MIRAQQKLCQPSVLLLKGGGLRPIQIHHTDLAFEGIVIMQTSHLSALPGTSQAQSAGGAGRCAAPSHVSGASAGSGSVRQATLRVIAAQVLSALTQDTGGLRGLKLGEGSEDRREGAAGSVAQALKSAAAQGADPQALLAKVQEGIESAQAALTKQGHSPAQVAAAAAQFTDRVANLMDAPATATPSTVDTLAASVQVSRKERGSLVLTTQDGDVLRIRFRASERQQLELASASTGNAQATSVELSSSARSRTRVDVEGSLDAGELKAIEDFVSKVDTLANEFFEGDMEAAFAAAAALDYDAGEIAGFSLKLSMSESMRARAVQHTTARAAPPAPPPDAGVAAPSSAAATQIQPASAFPAESGASTGVTSPASDPLRAVQDFTQTMLGTADAPLSVAGYKLAWSAKVKLAAEVVSVTMPAAAQKPGAALLNNVLDSAAAQAGADAPPVKLAAAA